MNAGRILSHWPVESCSTQGQMLVDLSSFLGRTGTAAAGPGRSPLSPEADGFRVLAFFSEAVALSFRLDDLAAVSMVALLQPPLASVFLGAQTVFVYPTPAGSAVFEENSPGS